MQNSLFNEPNKLLALMKEYAPKLYPSYIASKINKKEKELQELRFQWKHTTPEGRKNIEQKAKEIKEEIELYNNLNK